MLASVIGGIGVAFWLILTFLLEWLYPVAFELTASGATPGKRVFGLKVVMDNGLAVTTAAAVIRNLLRVADFLPFGYAFAIISLLIRRDAKRLGDLAAATIVVHVSRVERRAVLEEIAPIVPARSLSPDAQVALVALAARAHNLTSDRLDELAGLAASASGDAGRTGYAVTQRVLGVAQWVIGRRP